MDGAVLQRRPLPKRNQQVNRKVSSSHSQNKRAEKVEEYWINDLHIDDFPSFDCSYEDLIYYAKPRGPDPFPGRNPKQLPGLFQKQKQHLQNVQNKDFITPFVGDLDFFHESGTTEYSVEAKTSKDDKHASHCEDGDEFESSKAIEGTKIYLDEQLDVIDKLLKGQGRSMFQYDTFLGVNGKIDSQNEEELMDVCSFNVERRESSEKLVGPREELFLSEYSTAFKSYPCSAASNDRTIFDLRGSLFDNYLPTILPRQLDKLTSVNLSYNYFDSIPKQLFNIKNLISLNMRNNPVMKISAKIKKLTKLKNLNLSFCQLTDLNIINLFTLVNLEKLDLSYNYLSSIHEDVEKLRSLKKLSVDGNQLEYFPRSILNMKLNTLCCNSNFTNAVFWKDSCPSFPQRLMDVAMVTLGKINQLIRVPDTIQEKLFDGSRCPFCDALVAGAGVAAIKPALELFGVCYLPILFFVCSQTCKVKLQRATELPLVTRF